MKFSLILFVVCTLAVASVRVSAASITLPKEIVDLLENLSHVCGEESGVSKPLIEEMKKAKLSDDPKAKCYLKCMMRQLQAMKEDGTLDIDLIEATMPDELKQHGGVETVKKCMNVKEADMCETAYKLMVCFQKENPQLTALFE